MSRRRNGPLPGLVVSVLVVAVLITVIVKDGWLVWFPVLAALVVIGRAASRLSHR